ncbi:hypothetical protein [Streptomyces sp. CA-253872]|uniref:hypothetical protein n=1 Tax=Streptomyces sp. CA-253872 TaxID=3240067 RepID=UPI003D8B14D6
MSGITARVLSLAHLLVLYFLAHLATVTTERGGGLFYAVGLWGSAALSAVAGYVMAGRAEEAAARARRDRFYADLARRVTCSCDRWWTSLGVEHDPECRNQL